MQDVQIGGLRVVKETLQLVFKRPVLWVYAAFLFILGIGLHCAVSCYPRAVFVLELISFLLMVLTSCCVAHHAMHLIAQRPSSIRESVAWVVRHIKHILIWLLISALVSLGLRWLVLFIAVSVVFVGVMSSDWSFLTASLLVTLGVVLGLLSMLIVDIIMSGTPIVATQELPVGVVFRRIRYVWRKRAGAYIGASILFMLISLVVYALVMTLLQLVIPDIDSELCVAHMATLFMFFITVANTLLYYHLYYKDEQVLDTDLSLHESMR